MKVLYIVYEVASIYKRGGLGDVARSFPKAIKELGVDIRIGMPAYAGVIKPKYLPGTNIKMLYARDKELLSRVQHEKNKPAKGSVGFAYFPKKILEVAKQSGFVPDIIHCNDWHTGLVPALLKINKDPYFADTKTLLTIHNSNYQGIFQLKYLLNHDKTVDVGMLFAKNGRKFINYLRLGVMYADMINTVSVNFAIEIKNKKFGFGIGGILRKRAREFVGILNGIDYTIWNSSRDKLIYYKYPKSDVEKGKEENKRYLQKRLGLKAEDVPIFGMVARLTWQKGFDIVIPALSKLSRMPIQFVILGSGKKGIAEQLKKYSSRFENIAVVDIFDERLAHQIYAGSDFILIPSIFEPCGLIQMISMSYGTIPVASAVGGLVDTIADGKTGFLFHRHGVREMLGDIGRAIDLYSDKKQFVAMRKRCLKQDFSWEKSAKDYHALYKRLVKS